jgi:hypothetical protein
MAGAGVDAAAAASGESRGHWSFPAASTWSIPALMHGATNRFGFTGHDMELLAEQFVKPWDPDARAVLRVIKRGW